jgi:uncharacterized protein
MYQTVRHLINDGMVARESILWLRMDHPLLMSIPLGKLVREAIKVFHTHTQPLYLFLDEITYAEDWDLWLKTFYDENWPVKIVGSSSSSAALRKRKVESGVGRWEEQFLPPYLFTEYLDLVKQPVSISVEKTLHETMVTNANLTLDEITSENHRKRYLLTGGFPELLLGPQSFASTDQNSALLQSQKILRTDAVQSALYKDIPQAFGVDNPMLLERLLYTLGGQFTGVLSPNNVCASLDGMSQPTFDKYLSYLERAYLVFTLPNYSGAEASVQKRGRKLYFVDGAVRNAALQRGLMPLQSSEEIGMLVENMIAGHLFALSQLSQVRLYHWRDKNDEVDLVYDHPEYPMAFEIATGNHTRSGLMRFAERYSRFRGRCFLIRPGLKPRFTLMEELDDTSSYPLDLFLLAVSAQVEAALGNNLLSSSSQP